MKTVTWSSLAGLAVVLGVVGCQSLPSVGPDYKEPELDLPESPLNDPGFPSTNVTETGEWLPVPEEDDTRSPITENSLKEWWARFNDPVLTGLIECAVTNNQTFLQAQQRLIASRWELAATYSAFLPSVDLNGNATRGHNHRYTASQYQSYLMRGDKKSTSDLFHGGFDASWEIDLFGGSRRETESAYATAEAAGWSVADAWVSLTAEVAARYISLRTIQKRIEVARTNLVLQTETYEILKSRLESGIGDELAVNQSKYIVDQTRASIPPLLAKEETLMNQLAILTGDMPGARHAELAVCPKRDWLIEPQKLDKVPADLVRTRPDIRVAERQLAANVARIGVAKSQWFPRFFINGSLGLESVKAQKFFGKGDFYASLGPSISWPIFRGGAIYADVKRAEAEVEAAFLAYESKIQQAWSEVRDTYSSYTQDYHRFESLKGAVQAAQDAVAISKNLYRSGLRDFTAVIDAQRSLLSLQDELVNSHGVIAQDLISLYKALGGGLTLEGDEAAEEQ